MAKKKKAAGDFTPGTVAEKIRSGVWEGTAGIAGPGTGWDDASRMTMNRLNAKGIGRCHSCGTLYDLYMAGPHQCATCQETGRTA